MAQALAERMMPGEATFLSAGTDPAPRVDAGALEELSRRGVPEETVTALRPKYVSELPARVDWLVTVGRGVVYPALACTHREDWGLKILRADKRSTTQHAPRTFCSTLPTFV